MNAVRKLTHTLRHRTGICLSLAVVALALLAAKPIWRALAAAGDLDTSFNYDGKITMPMSNPGSVQDAAMNAILVQPDPNNLQSEKVVVASPAPTGQCGVLQAGIGFDLERLNSSGTPDYSFGNNGSANIYFSGTGLPAHSGRVTAMASQANGKILVAGILCLITNGPNGPVSGGSVAALARLSADGVLDTSFSDDGLWFFFGISEVSGMVIQSDGKILLVGRMKDSSNTYWKSAMWRLNSNGSTDTSFGTVNGSMNTLVWTGSSTDGGVREGFKSVFVQSDGKIAVLNNNGDGYRLRRFTASGATDYSLYVNASPGDQGNSIRGVGSSIWVIGSSGDYGAIFARNSINGLPTAGFGTNGKVVSSQPSVWTSSASVPFSFPAKYVVVGWNKYNAPGEISRAVVTRYFASGALDTGFGDNGSVETAGFDITSGGFNESSRYHSVRVGLTGRIVTGGTTSAFSSNNPTVYGVVARYLGN